VLWAVLHLKNPVFTYLGAQSDEIRDKNERSMKAACSGRGQLSSVAFTAFAKRWLLSANSSTYCSVVVVVSSGVTELFDAC
jgi:hypothetical protein